MKILVTTMQTEDDKKIVSTQFLSEETENIRHQIFDVEDIPDKEGYSKELVWNRDKNVPKLEYVKVPPTELEVLKDELKKTNKALQDLALSQYGEEE